MESSWLRNTTFLHKISPVFLPPSSCVLLYSCFSLRPALSSASPAISSSSARVAPTSSTAHLLGNQPRGLSDGLERCCLPFPAAPPAPAPPPAVRASSGLRRLSPYSQWVLQRDTSTESPRRRAMRASSVHGGWQHTRIPADVRQEGGGRGTTFGYLETRDIGGVGKG